MSRKARVTSLESVKGGAMSIKFVFSGEEGVYRTDQDGELLTKKDDKFFFSDGTPLHGEVKEENTRTIVLINNGK